MMASNRSFAQRYHVAADHANFSDNDIAGSVNSSPGRTRRPRIKNVNYAHRFPDIGHWRLVQLEIENRYLPKICHYIGMRNSPNPAFWPIILSRYADTGHFYKISYSVDIKKIPCRSKSTKECRFLSQELRETRQTERGKPVALVTQT